VAACRLFTAGAAILSTDVPLQRHAADCPRVVLDTNVSLALFAYQDGRCAGLLAALRAGRRQAVTHEAARSEWLRVLQRIELKFDPAQRVQAALLFDELVTLINTDAATRSALTLPRCRDPDDQIFLELARDSGAAVLYSRDRELLKLSRQTERRVGFVVLRPEDPCA